VFAPKTTASPTTALTGFVRSPTIVITRRLVSLSGEAVRLMHHRQAPVHHCACLSRFGSCWFELKGFLARYLSSLGHEVVDVGPDVFDVGDDYPPSCIETASRVVADPGSMGEVIGGLGNGEQISANKVAGCRAVPAWSTETARLAREHNDAQVLGVGARMHGPARAAEIVEAFLATSFSGGERHARRIRLIADFEVTADAPPMSAD